MNKPQLTNQFKKYQSAGLLATAIVIMLLTSCSSQRQTMRNPLKEQGAEYLVAKMKNNEIRNEYFSARFTAEILENKNSMSFNGQLRMRKDSLIWVTVSPSLNIEMGRMVITADSLKWINRIQSNYLLAPIDRLAAIIHPALSFDMAQAFILGNDLTLFEDSYFKTSVDKGKYRMAVTNRRFKKLLKAGDAINVLSVQNIWLNPKTFRITKVFIQDKNTPGMPQIEAVYSDFMPVGDCMFAAKQRYVIRSEDKKMLVNLNFTRIDNQPATIFPFSVPEKYTPVSTF